MVSAEGSVPVAGSVGTRSRIHGAGTSMGYDDLKIVEARKFLEAYFGGPAKNSNIHDAVSAARVVSGIEESAESKKWVSIKGVTGTTAAIRK